MKKGQGLSITTIVVAAIALLVLIVLVAVFTGRFGDFLGTVRSCDSLGGSCSDSCLGDTAPYVGATECNQGEASQKCCVPIGVQPSGED